METLNKNQVNSLMKIISKEIAENVKEIEEDFIQSEFFQKELEKTKNDPKIIEKLEEHDKYQELKSRTILFKKIKRMLDILGNDIPENINLISISDVDLTDTTGESYNTKVTFFLNGKQNIDQKIEESEELYKNFVDNYLIDKTKFILGIFQFEYTFGYDSSISYTVIKNLEAEAEARLHLLQYDSYEAIVASIVSSLDIKSKFEEERLKTREENKNKQS